MHLKICPLHKKFGVIVENINLDKVTKKNLYPEIRELFEEHSVLLFKKSKIFRTDTYKFGKTLWAFGK